MAYRRFYGAKLFSISDTRYARKEIRMKPHKDQQGYKYFRIKPQGKNENGHEILAKWYDGTVVAYCDDKEDWTRIISSERVERAVETDDFIRRLLSEGLDATVCQSGWCVSTWAEEGSGPTIRAAYENYRARIAHSASGGE